MRKLLLTLQYYLCLLVALLTASLSYAQNDKKTFQISGKRPAYDLLSIGSGSMSIQFFNEWRANIGFKQSQLL